MHKPHITNTGTVLEIACPRSHAGKSMVGIFPRCRDDSKLRFGINIIHVPNKSTFLGLVFLIDALEYVNTCYLGVCSMQGSYTLIYP